MNLVNGAIKIDDYKYLKFHNNKMKRNKIRTEKEFVKEIKNLVKRDAKFLNYSYLRKLGRYDLIYEAVKLFGGWRNACVYSTLEPLTRKWEKDEIISEMKTVANMLNKTPTREEVIKLGKHDLTRAAERKFGTWTSALIACGLNPNKRYDWSRKIVLNEIKNMAKGLGHTPSMNELKRLGKYDLLNAILRLFPTYNEFLSVAGLDLVTEMNKWSKEKIISEVKTLNEKFGRIPTRTEIEKMGRLDLKMATLRYFGSWNNAIISAGFNPNKDALKNDLGKRWEHFLIKVIKTKFKNAKFHERLPNKTIPDVLLPDEKKIIEIKSNASDLSIYGNIKYYSDFCNKLEFWHLYGIPPKIKDHKVIFKDSNRIRKFLLQLRNKKLLKEFFNFKKEAKVFDKEEAIEFLGM